MNKANYSKTSVSSRSGREQNHLEQFQKDVKKGLSSHPKHLSSKYLYDEYGDKLFTDIMKLDEYYLTRCEYEIIKSNREELVDLFAEEEDKFELIELGAGDGYKTKLLLNEIYRQGLPVLYKPVDISVHALDQLTEDLEKTFPDLETSPLAIDYRTALKEADLEDTKKVILFLGANIGNCSSEEALKFLKDIRRSMNIGDKLFIGFDLKKDPHIILAAYDDKGGVTKAFNLNVLKRINKELNADFDINHFDHYPVYNPVTGSAKSYLISLKQQEVRITRLNTTFHFDQWETIQTELSQKYSMNDIKDLCRKAGLKIVREFYDRKQYYVDLLMEKR